MSGVFEIAGSGLSAQQRALTILANNVTNVNTAGFKRSDVRYADVSVQVALAGSAAGTGWTAASGGGGVAVSAADELDRQGEVERTGRAMDLALDGRGFLELMGPGGEVLLWRGGPLAVTRDGYLGAGDGLPLLAMVQVPPDARSVQIGRDGTVSALSGDGNDRMVLGTVQIALPEAGDRLERLGGGLYRSGDPVGLRRAPAGEDGAAVFVQGALERSNVDLNEEMVRLLVVQRAYAANAQLVQAADQMMALANGLRRS